MAQEKPSSKQHKDLIQVLASLILPNSKVGLWTDQQIPTNQETIWGLLRRQAGLLTG